MPRKKLNVEPEDTLWVHKTAYNHRGNLINKVVAAPKAERSHKSKSGLTPHKIQFQRRRSKTPELIAEKKRTQIRVRGKVCCYYINGGPIANL